VGVGNVIPIREFIIELIQLSLRKSPPASTLETIKEAVSQYVSENELGIEPKT
jgi:hypothetical protein